MYNEKLRELRKKKNLTQEELAEKINVSRQTIVKWESGESEPSISIAKDIAEIFGVTVEEMTGITPKSKELSITRKVWTVVAIIVSMSFLFMFFVIIDPHVDNILDNASDRTFIAVMIFIIISVISLIVGYEYLKRYSIKNNDKQLYQKLLPTDIFGRPINNHNKKIRFLLYFFDTFGFLIFFVMIDVLVGEINWKEALITFIVIGIPFYTIETLLNERNIKKFNKMK